MPNSQHNQPATISYGRSLTIGSGNELFNFIKKAYKRNQFNARELHSILLTGKCFSEWIVRNIKIFGFIEGVDYTIEKQESTGGRPAIEYFIKFNMGLELIILMRAKRSIPLRRILIDCYYQLVHRNKSINH